MAKETLQVQPEADAGNQQRGKAAHISPNLPTGSEGGAMPSDAVFWHVWIVMRSEMRAGSCTQGTDMVRNINIPKDGKTVAAAKQGKRA